MSFGVSPSPTTSAWSCTLLHELVHLLFGHSGISGAHPGRVIEEFCTSVAAEWMLPTRMLAEIEIGHDVTEQQRRISEFVRPRNLSHTMVAYRLLRAKRIDQQAFDALRDVFRERWLHKRGRQRARARESDGGPRSLSDWPHRGRRRRAGVLRWRNNNLGNKPIWGSAWRLIWDIIGAVNDSRRSVHGRRLSRA